MVKPEKNKIYRLSIDGYGSRGEGVGRLNGQAVFVQGALRNEICDVRLQKVGKTALWGSVAAIVTPSPARKRSDCLHFPQCGGCQLRHMSYAEELELKRRRVEDALHRIGGVNAAVSVIHGAENTLRYRNKAQFPVSEGDRAPRIGFFRERSHEVIDVTDCLLQPWSASKLRAALRDWMVQFGISAYEERTHTGLVRHLFVRANTAGQTLCCVIVNGYNLPAELELVHALRAAEPGLIGVILGVNRQRTNVILGESYRTLWGTDELEDTLCGLSFRISVPSFYQVNHEQTEVLYGLAVEFAGLTREETVLDLYCGIGTITLAMARHAGRVIGAEVVPQAVEDAKANAVRNRISNAEFICADAGEAATALAEQNIRPDVICVDPPRKGLSADVIEAVAVMAPSRLVYVSCDPATLARDVKRLGEKGYALARTEAVDMFPHTVHVETVVLMLRTSGDK